MNIFKKQPKQVKRKKKAFNVYWTKETMKIIKSWENAFKNDPNVLRSSFNRDLYYEIKKQRYEVRT